MAEFENNYCTGCGYKVKKWGHRPYCWRVAGCLNPTYYPSRDIIKRCIKLMNKHHKIISIFLAKKKHIYYTIESIERAEEQP